MPKRSSSPSIDRRRGDGCSIFIQNSMRVTASSGGLTLITSAASLDLEISAKS